MAVLEQLGINQTVLLQFCIFVFSLIALSQLAFAPYYRAHEERERRTRGGEDLAQEILKQATDLKAQFETRARQVSGDIRTIFDSYREGGSKEYEAILAQARADSQRLVDEARGRVTVEVAEAAKRLKEEIPQVAQAITQKLIAK